MKLRVSTDYFLDFGKFVFLELLILVLCDLSFYSDLVYKLYCAGKYK